MDNFYQHESTSKYEEDSNNSVGYDFTGFLTSIFLLVIYGLAFLCPIIGVPIMLLIACSEN